MELKRVGYVLIGTGDLAAEKAKNLLERTKSVTKVSRKDIESFYGDLSKRGHNTWMKVSRSTPAKQAIAGTKQATRQLKGAATSLRKAVGREEEAPAS
jgi:siroheme synthase (precorrin-2 oxidase/ferrochelatase)